MTAGLMVQPPVRLFAHGAVIIDPMPQRIDAGIADDGGFALDRAHGLEHRRHDLGRRHVLLLVEHAIAPPVPAQPTLGRGIEIIRSEEHTSELQSLMRISYAVFCLKKKNTLDKKQLKTITTVNHK